MPQAKKIGLLGGTGWVSTITYYTRLNEEVNKRLGGFHSAEVRMVSIDYHEIMSSYGKDSEKIAALLQERLQELIEIKPDCLIICCNSLHKYLDILVKKGFKLSKPVMHAVELTAKHLLETNKKKVLLLATKATMDDGFFANILTKAGIEVTLPSPDEREQMRIIHEELMVGKVTQESKNYFAELTKKYVNMDGVVLGCSEYPLVLDASNSALAIINPLELQVMATVDFSLQDI